MFGPDTVRVVEWPSRVSCRSKISYGHDDFRAFILPNHRCYRNYRNPCRVEHPSVSKIIGFFQNALSEHYGDGRLRFRSSNIPDFSYRIRTGNRNGYNRRVRSGRDGTGNRVCPRARHRNWGSGCTRTVYDNGRDHPGASRGDRVSYRPCRPVRFVIFETGLRPLQRRLCDDVFFFTF